MAGINTLPKGTEWTAAIVLTYSAIGWLCSVTMIWLTWIHRQRFSYVAMIAYFSLLGTTMSIIQQSYDYTHWEEIVIRQWELVSTFPDSPELATAQGSQGLDLILFYIQFYTYNASALCVLFWSGELAQTLYGFDAKPRLRRACRKINQAGRAVAIVLPLFTTLMLRLPEVRAGIVSFLLVADLPLMLSLTMGGLMVMLILIRYLVTQKRFTHWSQPATDNSVAGRGTELESGVTSITVSSRRIGKEKIRSKQGGIYDRWLMIRFFMSFLMLGVFDVTTILFQLNALANNKKDGALTAPDLSAERARGTMLGFMPGVTPGIMLFLVFGTTAGHRTKLYQMLVPERWRGAAHDRLTLPTLKDWRLRAGNNKLPRTRKWPWANRGVERVPSYAMSPRLVVGTPAIALGPVRQHEKGVQSVDIMSMLTKETLADLQKPLPPYPTPVEERYSFETPATLASSHPPSIREARVEQVVWRTSIHDPAIRPVHIRQHARRESDDASDSDQSDQSGPVLPIMRNDQRKSRF